jgi:hypothetical protein
MGVQDPLGGKYMKLTLKTCYAHPILMEVQISPGDIYMKLTLKNCET